MVVVLLTSTITVSYADTVNNIVLKVNTYFSHGELVWGTEEGLYYKVYCDNGKGYFLYKNVGNSGQLEVPYSKGYMVKSYSIVDGSKVYKGNSNIIPLNKPKCQLSIKKKKVNGIVYSMKSYNTVYLNWDKVPGTVRYVVYKYNSKSKKYVKISTVNRSKDYLKVSSLNPRTRYYFKVVAEDGKGNKITSNTLKVITLSKTDGYFYNKVVLLGDWDNILITSSKASNTTMDNFSLKKEGYASSVKPFIKYNYSTKDNTLYIHTYVKMVGKYNSCYRYYKKNSKGVWVKGKISKVKYKTLVTKGITKHWSRSITGDKYDFVTGCNFKTKVIVHTNNPSLTQKRLTVNIGDSNISYKGYYWFTAKCFGLWKGKYCYLWDYGNNCINLATQDLLYKNLKKSKSYCPVESQEKYMDTVAHEFGHALGLLDAYDTTYNGKTLKRIIKTGEVGYYKNGEFHNIMYNSGGSVSVDNDIEMAIQAQSEAFHDVPDSAQAYKTHIKTEGYVAVKSSVIRK